MSKYKKPLRKRFVEGALSVLAICLVIFPIFSLGAFGYSQLFGDPRRIAALETIKTPRTPRLFKEGLVSVTFDDGWQSVYTDAAPVLEKYGIQSTQYILPGEFKSHNYISLPQAKSLKRAGHEIMSHTMTHPLLPEISSEQVTYELEASKKALLDNGLATQNMHFASPESATSLTVDAQIERHYVSHRNTFGDFDNGIGDDDVNIYSEAFDRYDIIGFSVRSSTTLEQIQEAIRYAKANNGWLVLVYHQIDSSGQAYSVTSENFARHMKLIRDQGIHTATLGAVLASREEL